LPVYVYRCEQCGSQLEKRQSFSDAPLTECEVCHGQLRKVLSPATIIYKGSGFYSTDHSSKSGGNGRDSLADRNGAGDKNGSGEKNGAEAKNGSAEKSGRVESQGKPAGESKDASKATASASKGD
jgi:putative FmdB family regulatory protein